MSAMKALVIGATGAVGSDLVEQLLKDDAFERVTVFVRRPLAVENPKLTVHIIDFDHPEQWRELLQGDVLFSCLGTTIKAAGSQEAQWKVDYTYQYEAAKAARENGVEAYALVSSIGASPKAKFFYTRMKGGSRPASSCSRRRSSGRGATGSARRRASWRSGPSTPSA